MKRALAVLAESWMLFLTFLLPLKFGVIAVMPETCSFFPGDLFSYCVVNWAATSFGLWTAPALVLVLAAHPGTAAKMWKTPIGIFALVWSIGLVLFSMPGLLHVSTWDFAVLQLTHFMAVGCYAAATGILVLADEPARKHLRYAMGAGFLLAVWFGLEQYFWGFDRSRAYLESQSAKGVAVGEVLTARTFDTRVFGTFTSSNSLAGYLLLLAPWVTVLAWKLGRKFDPVKVSCPLFAGIAGVSSLAVFLMTKSRAGYLALALTAGISLFFLPVRRWIKGGIAVMIALTIAGGAWYIQSHGRGFRSMTARTDYLRSSAILLAGSPVTGCGWGNFFFEHMRIKKVQDHEAAHDPHNLLMTGAQAGLPLVLLLAAGMLLPPLFLLKRKTMAPETRAELFGVTAFYMHSMMDIDLQIPGLMASYFLLAVLLLHDGKTPSETRKLPLGWMLLAFGCMTFYASYRELKGEMALDALQNLTRLGALPPEERACVTPERVEQALLTARKARPYSSQPDSDAGDYYFSIADWGAAEYHYRLALEKSPRRAGLYARLAYIAAQKEDRAKAAELMERARELFPNNPKYQRLAE